MADVHSGDLYIIPRYMAHFFRTTNASHVSVGWNTVLGAAATASDGAGAAGGGGGAAATASDGAAAAAGGVLPAPKNKKRKRAGAAGAAARANVSGAAAGAVGGAAGKTTKGKGEPFTRTAGKVQLLKDCDHRVCVCDDAAQLDSELGKEDKREDARVGGGNGFVHSQLV